MLVRGRRELQRAKPSSSKRRWHSDVRPHVIEARVPCPRRAVRSADFSDGAGAVGQLEPAVHY
jgi:hypothetical protein